MSDNFFKIKKGLNIDPTDAGSVSNPELGDLIIDSSDNNKLKKHNGTAFVNAVTKEDLSLQNVDNTSDADKPISTATQTALNTKVNSSGGTLTNGSIVTPSRLDTKQDTYANLVTYATTASNGQLVFATDTKEMYQVVDGFLKSVGGGAGGINYIDNGEFENNTTGWATYKDAAADSPADGTGGIANTTFTRTTSTPLRGNASGLITKSSGASRQGEGVSYDFTIDAADKAQVLRISFDYNTEVSTTDYLDGNIRVYVYDVTNSRLIEVIDRDLYASSFGKFVGTFQTSSDSVSYRLIFHITDTSTTTAYTVEIDNVIVGPQTIVKGAIVTDWEGDDSVVTFSNVTGVLSAFKKRTGDTLSIKGTLTLSSTPTGVMQLVLASGYSLDFTKISSNIPMGTISFRKNSAPSESYLGFFSPIAATNSFNLLTSRDTVNTGTSYISNNAAVSTTVPFTWASGDLIRFEISDIPIQGWSSNVVLSEDAGNRDIVFKTLGNPTLSAFDNTANVIWSSGLVRQDTTASYDPVTGQYTIPESGVYDISSTILIAGTESLNSLYTMSLYLDNTSALDATAERAYAAGVTSQNLTLVTQREFTKGDKISLRINTDVGTPSIASSSAVNRWSIAKRSSPQTIAASEVVHLSLQHNSGQVIPNSATTTLVYNTIVEDTHNAYNSSTGIWICPQSGYYQVSANLMFTSATGWTEGESITLTFLANNSSRFRGYLELYASSTTAVFTRPTTISGVVYISKGENAYLQISQGNDASVAIYSANGTFNTFTITKVG